MSVPRQPRAGDRCDLTTDSVYTNTVMPPQPGAKRPRLKTSHPDVHEKVSAIVKAHVIMYDPVKLGQMTRAQKEAVNSDLRQAVHDELPDDCGVSAAQVRDTLKESWRTKLDQPAIISSKHQQACGKRRQVLEEYHDAKKEQANGTLTADHPAFSMTEAYHKV